MCNDFPSDSASHSELLLIFAFLPVTSSLPYTHTAHHLNLPFPIVLPSSHTYTHTSLVNFASFYASSSHPAIDARRRHHRHKSYAPQMRQKISPGPVFYSCAAMLSSAFLNRPVPPRLPLAFPTRLSNTHTRGSGRFVSGFRR